MGSPFGLDQTVTAGIISKKERESPYFNVFQRFLQTDAAINRGNSGGPLVNMRGEVIGMNSQIATSTGDYNGIGFALPSNETNFVYKQLLTQGKVKRGYLGITLESVHDQFAKVYGLAEAKGAIVMTVTVNEEGAPTPAQKAGMQASDIIVEFEGAPVSNAQDLIQRVASTPVGQQISLGFLRDVNGKLEKRTVSVALGERPPSTQRAEWVDPPKATPKTVQGLYVKEIDPNGLVAEIRIQPAGVPALSEGDVVNRINRVPVTTLAEFQRVLSGLKAGDPIVMNVTRRDPRGDRQVPLIVQFTYQ
jgi:serine protease Do